MKVKKIFLLFVLGLGFEVYGTSIPIVDIVIDDLIDTSKSHRDVDNLFGWSSGTAEDLRKIIGISGEFSGQREGGLTTAIKAPTVQDMLNEFKAAASLLYRYPGMGVQKMIAASEHLTGWANTLTPEAYSKLDPEWQQAITTSSIIVAITGIFAIKYRKAIGERISNFAGSIQRAPRALWQGVRSRLSDFAN